MKLVLALLGALLFTSGVHAQTPSSYALKDSNGVALNVGVFQCPTNKICPLSVSSDSAGNPLSGLAGTTNPVNTALYVQGVTSGVPVGVTFSSPQHVICDSGCAGGGSGGNVNLTQILGVAPSASNPLWIAPATGVTFPISGSIGNTSFGISGTLPAFATTPTFNIGTAPTIAVTGTFFQTTQPVSISGTLPVSIAAPVAVTGTFFQTTQPVSVAGSVAVTGTFFPATQPISAVSLPLATDAATATAQGTAQTSLTAIANNTARIPAQGQALAAASMPVVLTALQITALTPPTTLTVQQPTGTNLHMVCDSGCSSSSSPSFGSTFPTTGTPIGMSQGGVLTAFTGTGGSLNVNITGGGGSGGGTSSSFAAAFPATGTALGVSNGTNMVAVVLGQAVAASSLPVVLPTAQITALTPPTSVGLTGTLPAFTTTPTFNIGTAPTIAVTGTFFQTTQPVSIASAVAVTGTFFQATQPISATALPLPAGAATATLQGSGNSSVASIDTKTPALGQALAAASTPVVLTALQLTALTPLSSVTVTQATGTNLHVVCDSGCSGSGGTSSAFAATFPASGTAMGAKNGANMVNLTADASGNLNVNVQGAVGAAIGSATSGSTGSLIMGAVQTTGAVVTNGNTNPFSMDVNSNLRVVFANTTLAVTNAGTFATQQTATTTGGATAFTLIAAATNNSTLISTGTHNVYAVQVGNNSANIAYLKLYNKATAPTCGTDTPVKTLIIPASTSGAGSNVQVDIGLSFSLGLGICVVNGIAVTDNTSVAASAFAINVDFK